MPFKSTFEKHLNRNLRGEDQNDQSHAHDEDIKQPAGRDEESEDYEIHHKKDTPPRFSTLYGPPQPRPRSPSPRREYYPAPERRKSGVWLPWSLFILLAIMLFLESTILFTYTIIGLYNNTPSRVFSWAGPGTSMGMGSSGVCEMQKEVAQQPAINIAPNFMMPQAAQPTAVTVTVTSTSTPTTLPEFFSRVLATPTTTSSSTTTTSTSSTTSTIDTSSAAAAFASEVVSMLATAKTSSSISSNTAVATVTAPAPVSVVTQTISPSQSLTTSVTLLTVGTDGKPITPTGSATAASSTSSVTQTTSFVAPVEAGVESSSSSSLSPASTLTTSTVAPSSTTAPPPPSSTTTLPPPPPTTTSTHAPSSTTTSSKAKDSGKACFGGSGAVELVCVGE